MDNVPYDALTSAQQQEDSATVRERVNVARSIQNVRFEGDGIRTNAEMGERELASFCRLSAEGEGILRAAFERMKLSARARSRILKVARTIADLAACEEILPAHVYEAVSYRLGDSLE